MIDDEAAFIYFECPECEFSSVQRADFTGNDLCPLCAGDNGRDVAMKQRVARTDDKAEGRDARKEP
jgi:hypothetical protein